MKTFLSCIAVLALLFTVGCATTTVVDQKIACMLETGNSNCDVRTTPTPQEQAALDKANQDYLRGQWQEQQERETRKAKFLAEKTKHETEDERLTQLWEKRTDATLAEGTSICFAPEAYCYTSGVRGASRRVKILGTTYDEFVHQYSSDENKARHSLYKVQYRRVEFARRECFEDIQPCIVYYNVQVGWGYVRKDEVRIEEAQ